MKALLRAAWNSDRHAFVYILMLNIASSILSGIGIVMLVPLLNLLDIGTSRAMTGLAFISASIESWPYASRVAAILAAYVLLVTAKATLGRIVSIRESAYMEETGYRLREEFYEALSGLEWERLATEKQTDLINLFTNQCAKVCSGYDALIGLFTSIVTAVIQLSIALLMNLPLTLSVCMLGGLTMMMFMPLRRKSKEFGSESIRINQEFYSELINQMSSIKETRAYGVEEEQAQRFSRISSEFRDAHMRYRRLFTIPQVVYNVSAALLIAAVYLIATVILHVEVDRLVVLVYIFARLWPLFSGLQGDIQYIYGCVPAYEQFSETLRNMKAAREHGEIEVEADFDSWKSVALQNVTFRYCDGDAPVLKAVSFELQIGRVTALLGRNGTGKTTVANLLSGLLKPNSGTIEIDGVSLTGQNLRAWRRQVGYVPQDPFLLNASVRENLRRFHPSASEEEMVDALKRALAWDVVRTLPQGMDTQLGERGIRLSGGERQRIVLARVLIGKPRLVILDEATSAMDYESELAFQKMIRSVCADMAVLLIAHRLSTIRMASHVIVLENGEIAEDGTLDELLHRQYGYLSGMLYVD